MKFLLICVCVAAVFAEESTIYLKEDMETVTLECKHENPRWWYTSINGEVASVSNSSQYNMTSKSNAGLYECIANSSTIESVTAAKIVPPTLVNMRKSITYTEGDHERKIVCTAIGSYPAVEFVWLKQDEGETGAPVIVSPETDNNIHLNETVDSSTLLFYNLTYDVAGLYECKVENIAGNYSIELTVRVKDKYAALWPFLGIVCEVVILILIIFIYEKNSKKDDDEPATLDLKDDEKPLNKADEAAEENGNEMRNRGSVKA